MCKKCDIDMCNARGVEDTTQKDNLIKKHIT